MDARVDRKRLVEWLLDEARDEDETAAHRDREGDTVVVVSFHRDRARTLRDVARKVEAGDPDEFVPPDLRKRESGEHSVDFGVTVPEPRPSPEVVTRPVPRRDPRRDDD